jgi:hypothetical protein
VLCFCCSGFGKGLWIILFFLFLLFGSVVVSVYVYLEAGLVMLMFT